MAHCLSKTRGCFRSHATSAVVLGFCLGLNDNIKDRHDIQEQVMDILNRAEVKFLHEVTQVRIFSYKWSSLTFTLGSEWIAKSKK